MKTINLKFSGDHAIVELNRPKAHAINSEMVHDLHQAVTQLAESESVKGAILTGQGGIFSAGLDVVELYGLDAGGMDQFWADFGRLLRDMIAFPKPLVAAINGHAPAGGCVFALTCDHRVMAYGSHTIGLNEVPVGIVVPEMIVELARFTMGNRKAAQMFADGLLLEPEPAREFGLVDETCPANELMIWAETKIKKWIAMPEHPWRAAKADLRRPLLNAIHELTHEANFGGTLRAWWDAESRAKVKVLVDKLKK